MISSELFEQRKLMVCAGSEQTFLNLCVKYVDRSDIGVRAVNFKLQALDRRDNQKIVSGAELHYCDRGIDMFTVWDLETLPGYLRQGYASAVVRGCVELVRQAGSNASLVTYVDVVQPEGELGRRELLSMYERLGFKRIDTIDIGPNKRVKRRVHMLAHTEFGEY